MKATDLRRIKIREIPPQLRKRDKQGNELAWEVSAPKKLNGGKSRFRRGYRTKAEAVAVQTGLVNKILNRGTKTGLTVEDDVLFHRVKTTANEANIPLSDIELILEREIVHRTSPTNFYRVSDLFAYYRKEQKKGDGVTKGWKDGTEEAEEMFIEKWGDLLLRDVRKPHAEDLLNDPPERKDGKPRFWSVSSKKTWRGVYRAVWNFGLAHWTDDLGNSYVPFNPWDILWFGKVRGKRGVAVVYNDLVMLGAVYRKLGEKRSDLLPAWILVLKVGVRPVSELAGGKSQEDKEYNKRGPLTWGAVKLEGGKLNCGEVDLWCFKTEDGGTQRRFVPLHPEDARLLALYKPHFKDTDPILPGNISAFDQVMARVFREVGMELYGEPLFRHGPKGERDLGRHSCLSAFLAETDDDGKTIHSLDNVAMFAGHEGLRILLAYYIGAMTAETANAFWKLGMPTDWLPSLKKAKAADYWYPEEAQASQHWGRHMAEVNRVLNAQTLDPVDDNVSAVNGNNESGQTVPVNGNNHGLPQTMQWAIEKDAQVPVNGADQAEFHAKQVKHGPTTTNQEASCYEI